MVLHSIQEVEVFRNPAATCTLPLGLSAGGQAQRERKRVMGLDTLERLA
jgi:hypothetical protein